MKTILRLIGILFFTILNVACNHGQSSKSSNKLGEVSVINPTEFKEKSINQLIIDVRTPSEFNEGHIESAVNIDFLNTNFLEQISLIDKSKTLFIYCKSGKRSASAATKLAKIGFNEIYDLEGGIKNWVKTQHQIVK